ncbi:MAG: 2,3-bisphosphoglycerate-independent phosphoglycerate mutase [Chloroflexi bacterium]|nr:2,3-bisphosphoglycerate-independent phosphoglycerate mutase [Chloroflexota bacterium]
MANFAILKDLLIPNQTKILLLVMDGLGGLPIEPNGPTELEAALTPNMDHLAAEGTAGLHIPIQPGLTPGSGPAHLGLFGYDPLTYVIGRGALEAVGIGFDLHPRDLAARGNFCTVDKEGNVIDRRAGRIATDLNEKLCERLSQIQIPGVQVFVKTVEEYRFLLVLRGEGLSEKLNETDPQRLGVPPLDMRAESPEAETTAGIVRKFIDQARRLLQDQHPANMILLRGFSHRPAWPQYQDIYGLKAASIAVYPMYRGVAQLVGMQELPTGHSIADEVTTLEQHWSEFDFFFLHVKKTDSYGEDGNFKAKVGIIEEVDQLIPRIRALKPDVLIITGDHSTPALLRTHSWHPVPLLLWGRTVRPDTVQSFGERPCMGGGLGTFPSVELMPLALAHAQRLTKFGA